MNIIIFCLTILVIYGILSYAYKAWRNANLKDKMANLVEVESQEKDILIFKKAHKGDFKKKRKTIKKFTKE